MELKAFPVVSFFQKKILQRATLLREKNIQPGLAVIQVGDDVASTLYLKKKHQACQQCCFSFGHYSFSSHAAFQEIEQKIQELNRDPLVHGIILQLPLPAHLSPLQLITCITPEKDVDGLHPLNQGKLCYGHEGSGLIPCTPLGCLMLLMYYNFSLKNKRCIVVGRSILVGKPLGALLAHHHATVTLTHSYTDPLAQVTQEADFLFVAAGQPQLIQSKHIKKGCVIVDIGIHSVVNSLHKKVVVGDVDRTSVAPLVHAITPVPGGVGPMTVLGLMHNTLKAAHQINDMPFTL